MLHALPRASSAVVLLCLAVALVARSRGARGARRLFLQRGAYTGQIGCDGVRTGAGRCRLVRRGVR